MIHDPIGPINLQKRCPEQWKSWLTAGAQAPAESTYTMMKVYFMI